MDAKQPALTVVYAVGARIDLDQIWEWNAKQRGPDHASDYIETLERQIATLATEPEAGTILKADSNFRYLTIRKRPKVDGHVAGYRIDRESGTIRILRIYHTKQNWQSDLEREEP